MYLLIIIFKKSEFMAAQRARPILLNERFLVISVIKNVERASTARARESRDFHVRGTESGPMTFD